MRLAYLLYWTGGDGGHWAAMTYVPCDERSVAYLKAMRAELHALGFCTAIVRRELKWTQYPTAKVLTI